MGGRNLEPGGLGRRGEGKRRGTKINRNRKLLNGHGTGTIRRRLPVLLAQGLAREVAVVLAAGKACLFVPSRSCCGAAGGGSVSAASPGYFIKEEKK